jgi:hypothetical protein
MSKYEIYYDIDLFQWVKSNRTFYADGWDLWPEPAGDYKTAFPNGKQQFLIINNRTKGFRRFRYVEDFEYTQEFDGQSVVVERGWLFTSEDGILCKVYIER